jgi:hypothetical protein
MVPAFIYLSNPRFQTLRQDESLIIWTKEHLDAYLASADVIIDQRDEPG